MKTIGRICCVALAVLTIAGCAQTSVPAPTVVPDTPVPPTAVPPTAPPPKSEEESTLSNAAIVQDMIDRLNAGDVEGSLDYFAEDAFIYFVGMPPTGMEYYKGRDQIRPMWEYCKDDNFLWETEITSEKGDLVYVHAWTWLDFTRDLGTAPNEFMDIYRLEDGKIVEYYSIITETALAKFKPALLAVMPLETASKPVGAPADAVTITIANGTCTYEGPRALQKGEVKITLDIQDKNKFLYALTAFTLDGEHDMVDLMASTMRDVPPSWAEMIFIEEIQPAKVETYTLNIEEGPIYMVCWSQPPDLAIGNIGPFEVK